jgi:hypothetical protein
MKLNNYALYLSVGDKINGDYIKAGSITLYPHSIKYNNQYFTWMDEIVYPDDTNFILNCYVKIRKKPKDFIELY